MKRLFLSFALCAALLSCNRVPPPEEARKQVVGEYALHIGSSCSERNIEYDRLTLHADGRLTQLSKFRGAPESRIESQWRYSPPKHVVFDRIKDNSATMDGGEGRFTLIVEFTNPPVILLHPDMNCHYFRDK